MKSILADAQREVLEQLAWADVLLGFDFDPQLWGHDMDSFFSLLASLAKPDETSSSILRTGMIRTSVV